MPSLTVSRTINAPAAGVFRALADVREFAKVQPQIVDVQFLSEQRSGAGTRFRETRVMGGRKASTELEITEHVENERVRFVGDSMGTVWDTRFVVAPASAGACEVTMTTDARPHTFLARLMTPLMMGMVRKALLSDLDRVKAYCEGGAGR